MTHANLLFMQKLFMDIKIWSGSMESGERILLNETFCEVLTVAPGADVKVQDTWNFFIVISVRGGQRE